MNRRGFIAGLAAISAGDAFAQAAPAVPSPLFYYAGQPGRLTQDRDRQGGNPFASALVEVLRKEPETLQDFTARLALTPDELARFLEPLTAAGTDIFHCSTRRFWEPEFEGSTLNLAGWTKKLTGKPTITVGSVGLNGADFVQTFRTREDSEIGDLGELEARLERDEFDLVAVGRALLADPHWAIKVREGRFSDLAPFSASSLATLT